MSNSSRLILATAAAAMLAARAAEATPQRPGPGGPVCGARQSEALASAPVLASAAGPQGTNLAAATPPASSPSQERQRRLQFGGQRYASPTGARTEAGLGLSLGSQVTIQLNYERTASVPMMGYANDNGILARLRIGF